MRHVDSQGLLGYWATGLPVARGHADGLNESRHRCLRSSGNHAAVYRQAAIPDCGANGDNQDLSTSARVPASARNDALQDKAATGSSGRPSRRRPQAHEWTAGSVSAQSWNSHASRPASPATTEAPICAASSVSGDCRRGLPRRSSAHHAAGSRSAAARHDQADLPTRPWRMASARCATASRSAGLSRATFFTCNAMRAFLMSSFSWRIRKSQYSVV